MMIISHDKVRRSGEVVKSVGRDAAKQILILQIEIK